MLLEGLRDHGASNVLTALSRLPRNLRSMYLHALQSFVWNHAVSERLRRYGCERVVEGDLILPHASGMTPADECALDIALEDASGPAEPAADDVSAGVPSADPHVVTAAEAAAGTFSIDEVVMPLPGYKVMLPTNEMAQVYTKLLESKGLTIDCFNHHVRELAQPGAYRPIVRRPIDLTWDFFRYSDPTKPLVQTDLAALRNEPLPQGDPTGPMRAVVLSFTLPSSTYATMLLRELTKQATDLAHQKELNVGLPTRPENKSPMVAGDASRCTQGGGKAL